MITSLLRDYRGGVLELEAVSEHETEAAGGEIPKARLELLGCAGLLVGNLRVELIADADQALVGALVPAAVPDGAGREECNPKGIGIRGITWNAGGDDRQQERRTQPPAPRSPPALLAAYARSLGAGLRCARRFHGAHYIGTSMARKARGSSTLGVTFPEPLALGCCSIELVEEAVKLARGGASGLRMRRTLRAVGDDWTLRGEVVVPTSISEPQLVELFGDEASQLPSRFELYIEDESRSRIPLALATQTERGARKGFKLEAIGARLHLLRQIAEAVRYAHAKRLVHRALSPQSILVLDPEAPLPRIQIFNWQTAAREGFETRTAGSGTSGTSHLEALVEEAAWVYMAPEAVTDRGTAGEQLDVFSLGAIAYQLFSGQPPASSFYEMTERLREEKGLQISSVLDGAWTRLQLLIQYATHPEVTTRLESAAEFLEEVERLEEEITQPEERPRPDPLGARAGDELEHGLVVKKRLGKGSTALALLVDLDGREQVLNITLLGGQAVPPGRLPR